jgi:transcriptional regulator with XRE-family HTH domain
MSRIRADELHKEWMANDPEYRREWEALESKFTMIDALIGARARAGLTQEELARRMGTTQATIGRLESGGTMPSTRTLQRYAEATDSWLKITLEPKKAAMTASSSRGRG